MICESAADVLVISWDTVSCAKAWDGTGQLKVHCSSEHFTPSWLSTLPKPTHRLSIATSTDTAKGAGCRNVARIISPAGLKEVGYIFLATVPLSRNDGDGVGSSGDVIVGHFAINYHNEADALGIDLAELYAAQVADAEVNPPDWDIQGRQSNVYK